MHTYLALLLMQESFFDGGLTDKTTLREAKANLQGIDEWKTNKETWIPYIWAFRQYTSDFIVRLHKDGKPVTPTQLKEARNFLKQNVGYPFNDDPAFDDPEDEQESWGELLRTVAGMSKAGKISIPSILEQMNTRKTVL